MSVKLLWKLLVATIAMWYRFRRMHIGIICCALYSVRVLDKISCLTPLTINILNFPLSFSPSPVPLPTECRVSNNKSIFPLRHVLCCLLYKFQL